jgi:hypothetical protein
MKKILLSLILGVSAIGAYAQGNINFDNRVATLGFSALVTNVMTGAGLVGTNYVAQLYYAADAANLSAVAAVTEATTPFRIPTTTQPGTWNGGIRTLTTANGQTVNLIVRVWDGALYANYAAAKAPGASGVTGQSAAFSYVIPATNTDPTQQTMVNFRGFTVVPVPEPSTIALGILGAGSLLFLRRKK